MNWIRLTISGCAAFACFGAAMALAQEAPLPPIDGTEVVEEEVRRYTVELIVFAYPDHEAPGTELFEPDPVDLPVEPPLISDDELTALTPEEETSDDVASIFDELPDQSEQDEEPLPVYSDRVVEYTDSEVPLATLDDLLAEYAYVELVELIGADTIDLHILLPEELTMVEAYENLVLLDAYRPVLWGGWTQVIRAEEETPFIRLRRLGNLPLAFEGSLKLYLSRFLHLTMDITMDGGPILPDEADLSALDTAFQPIYEDGFEEPISAAAALPLLRYKIVENRIMKSEEVRFFDHPKFGVIAKVTRYVKPEGVEEDEDLEQELDADESEGAASSETLQ